MGSATGCKEQGMLFLVALYTQHRCSRCTSQVAVQTGLYKGQKTWGKKTLFQQMIPNTRNC